MSRARVDIERTVDAFGDREVLAISKWYDSFAWLGVLFLAGASVPILLLGSGWGEAAFVDPPILGTFFVVSGLWLLVGYWTLTAFVNRTTIRLGRTLSVRHAPLPWPGGLDVDFARIEGFDLQPYLAYRRGRWRRVGSLFCVRLTGGLVHRLLPASHDIDTLERVREALIEVLQARRGLGRTGAEPRTTRSEGP
jgi:hypothetical protein